MLSLPDMEYRTCFDSFSEWISVSITEMLAPDEIISSTSIYT